MTDPGVSAYPTAPVLTRSLTLACAVACGAMAGNMYLAQPLIGVIAPELHLSTRFAGLIVTLTQAGYGLGLLLIVPLADRTENRRLILASVAGTIAALLAVAAAPTAATFLAASMALGICSAGAQVIVPYAAALAPEERRGAAIGNVMAGLLAGIMLARPVASILTRFGGWRLVFRVEAGLMLAVAVWLAASLPSRMPEGRDRYGAILRSVGRLLATNRTVQRRAVYQGLAFAVFNIFWTAAPLVLVRNFGLGQAGVAVFAFAGAAGALAAPVAGRLGDRGHVRSGTALALATIALGCLMAGWSVALRSLAALVAFAVLIDAGTQINQVLGQRVIYGIAGAARGRVNAAYMTVLFLLGGCGSAIATLAYAAGGWWATMLTGAGLSLLALSFFATERRGGPAR